MSLLRDHDNSDGIDLGPTEAAPEPRPDPRPVSPYEGAVVAGAGPAYYLVERGKRRLLPDMAAFYRIGLRPVQRMSDADLEAIPEGKAVRA